MSDDAKRLADEIQHIIRSHDATTYKKVYVAVRRDKLLKVEAALRAQQDGVVPSGMVLVDRELLECVAAIEPDPMDVRYRHSREYKADQDALEALRDELRDGAQQDAMLAAAQNAGGQKAHKPGCPAEGGYGNGPEDCICGVQPATDLLTGYPKKVIATGHVKAKMTVPPAPDLVRRLLDYPDLHCNREAADRIKALERHVADLEQQIQNAGGQEASGQPEHRQDSANPSIPPATDLVKCGNCKWRGGYSEANEAKDLLDRHVFGDTFSDIECPLCGALCFPYDKQNR